MNKFLLFIISLLFSTAVFSQSPIIINQPYDFQKWIRVKDTAKIDGVLLPPYGDTTGKRPSRNGAIMMHTNGVYYKWNSGIGWNQLGSSGASGFDEVLTYNPNLNSSHSVNQNGHALQFKAGRLQFDSTYYTPLNTFFSTDSITAAGHSIVEGLGAGSPDSAFINILSRYFDRPAKNVAIIGADLTSTINQLNRYGKASRATIVMGALNTLRNGWSNYKTYNRCVEGYKAVWINQFYKDTITASGVGVTRYGTWSSYAGSVDGSKTGLVAYTNTLNDSLVYTFNDTTVYLRYMVTDGSASQYTGSVIGVYVDGVLKASLTTNNMTDGGADPAGGGFLNHLSPSGYVIAGLSPGTHKLKIVNTQSNYMYIDCVGSLMDSRSCFPLLKFDDPYMNATGYAGQGSNALVDYMNNRVDSMLATMPKSYTVYIGKTNDSYTATDDIGGDGIHPNDKGNREIAHEGVLGVEIRPDGTFYFTNGALRIKTEIKSEKVLTSSNIVGNNGVLLNDDNIKLDRPFTVVPGNPGVGTGTYIGINNSVPGAQLDISNSTADALNINRTSSNGTALSLSMLNSKYAFIALGNANPFIGGSANYNDLSLGAFGNIHMTCSGGKINMWYSSLLVDPAGSSTIHSSAAMQVVSTTKGFLTPVMTTTQRSAISSPAAGLEVFDTDLGRKVMYNGIGWQPVAWTTDSVDYAQIKNKPNLQNPGVYFSPAQSFDPTFVVFPLAIVYPTNSFSHGVDITWGLLDQASGHNSSFYDTAYGSPSTGRLVVGYPPVKAVLNSKLLPDETLSGQLLITGPTVGFSTLEAPVYQGRSIGIRLTGDGAGNWTKSANHGESAAWDVTTFNTGDGSTSFNIGSPIIAVGYDELNIQYIGQNGYSIKRVYSGLGAYNVKFILQDAFGNPVTSNPTTSDEIVITNGGMQARFINMRTYQAGNNDFLVSGSNWWIDGSFECWLVAAPTSTSSVLVRWQTKYPSATNYKIYRSTTKYGARTLIHTGTDGSFTDTGLSSNTLYFYHMVAVIGGVDTYITYFTTNTQ